MNRAKKRIKKRYVALIALLAIVAAAYLFFVSTRYSDHTTYIPFSGRVFKINSEDVDSIRIVNGSNGNMYMCIDHEEIDTWVEHLNSMRYRYWIPDAPIQRSGYRFALWLTVNGEAYSYLFDESNINVKGIWFTGSDQYFSNLTDMVTD